MEDKKIFNDIKEVYADVVEDPGTKVWKITRLLSKWEKGFCEYVDEIHDTVVECFKHKFNTSEAFCRYVCKSVRRRIHTLKELESLKAKNGGSKGVTEYALKRIRELKKELEIIEKNSPDMDAESRIEKVAKIKGVRKATVLKWLKIMSGRAFENPSQEKHASFSPDTQTILLQVEKEWEKKWKNKKYAPMLSELLTVHMLRKHGFDIDDLDGLSFTNKEICEIYAENPKSKLLDYQEIAHKYDQRSKSDASKKLSRFFEPFKDSLKNF